MTVRSSSPFRKHFVRLQFHRHPKLIIFKFAQWTPLLPPKRVLRRDHPPYVLRYTLLNKHQTAFRRSQGHRRHTHEADTEQGSTYLDRHARKSSPTVDLMQLRFIYQVRLPLCLVACILILSNSIAMLWAQRQL